MYDKQLCTEQQYVNYLRELNTSKTKTLFHILNECNVFVDVIVVTSSNLFDCCLEIIKSLQLHQGNPQYVRFF